MNDFLNLVSGISWGLVYLVAILRGFKYKTWCIPKLAICQNFAWEFWIVVSRIMTHSPLNASFLIQVICLALDVGILITWFLYDRDKPILLLLNIALFATVMGVMYIVAFIFAKWAVVAFLINLIMSAVFIIRVRKHSGPWMSRFIAIGKMVGTLAATILCGFITWNPLILWMGGLCFLLDVQYTMMFLFQQNRKGTIS